MYSGFIQHRLANMNVNAWNVKSLRRGWKTWQSWDKRDILAVGLEMTAAERGAGRRTWNMTHSEHHFYSNEDKTPVWHFCMFWYIYCISTCYNAETIIWSSAALFPSYPHIWTFLLLFSKKRRPWLLALQVIWCVVLFVFFSQRVTPRCVLLPRECSVDGGTRTHHNEQPRQMGHADPSWIRPAARIHSVWVEGAAVCLCLTVMKGTFWRCLCVCSNLFLLCFFFLENNHFPADMTQSGSCWSWLGSKSTGDVLWTLCNL